MSGKIFPKLFAKNENCCGCSACFAICPKNAIQMKLDDEGFLYPVVDYTKCIRCYKCMSVCAFKEDQAFKIGHGLGGGIEYGSEL